MPLHALPVGTVSFLFTDIEGSTRLLRTLGRTDFVTVIERHNEIFRSIVGDAEVSTEGDAFFCAFETPIEAVEAATSIQRLLHDHAWPQSSEVLVRMGIHTGEGRLGGDSYVGLDVHKAARIASAAHGGQVLVSDATRALIEHAVPEGAALIDLGEHQLKDLAQPERLFQLSINGLRSDFPTINSIGSAEVHLPTTLTGFVGRESELRAVADAFTNARLVSLVGIGGSGKTRLAIEAARDVGSDRGGVFFVDLADAIDAEMIAKTTAGVLSLPEQAGRPIEGTLIEFLTDRSDLLIFDNCEQVIDEAAGIVESLLRSCPELKVLATSREALRIAGEQLINVGSMQLPDPTDSDRAMHTDAVQLFVSRAVQAHPAFDADPWIDEIAAICLRLEGIPLAIELAAARSAVLNPREILDRLEDRFSLLKSRSRSGERRHGTLEAAMDWSYELLDEPSQRLLCWLSIFRGGFTLRAAWSVCFDSTSEPDEVLDRLEELHDKSLVIKDVGFDETRFRLLETVRDYAARRLEGSGDLASAGTMHRQYFSSFVKEQTRRLGGADQLEALDLLEGDHDNLRAVIRRHINEGDFDSAADIAGQLSWFWYLHAHFAEGERWSDELLEFIPPVPDRPWLRLLIGTAQYDYRVGEFERANVKLQNAVEFAARTEQPRLEMWAHAYLATTEIYRMDMVTAREESVRALELANQEGDLIGLGYATYMRVNADSGSLLIKDQITPERAGELLAQLTPVAEAARALGDRNMIGHVGQTEGLLAFHAGDTERASAAFDAAVVALTEIGTVGCVGHCIDAIADYASATGFDLPAARLLGASDGLRQGVGVAIAPMEDYFRAETRRKTLAATSNADLEREIAAGQALSLPEASQLARQILTDILG